MASVINNGIPLINGMLSSWADVVVLIGGVPLTGITAIDYGDNQNIVNVWGAGRLPVGRVKGRIEPFAKLTLLQEEVWGLQAQSPNGRLQDLPLFDITVQFLPDSGLIITDKIRNCQFTGNSRKLKEGDTAIGVELELVISHIDWDKKNRKKS